MQTERSNAQIVRNLRLANEQAKLSVARGNHPFGAILVDADNETVLMASGNQGSLRHAEIELIREASSVYSPEQLWRCALYSTVEPCVMCAGAQYWANIGTLVYGVAESTLLRLTGDHAANPTLNVPSRHVFTHGQKAIEVLGPVIEVEQEIVALHETFWT